MLAVYACTPAGAATGTPLGYTYLYAPDNPTASAEQKPVLNAWMSVAIKGITVPMNAAHYGLVCVLSCGSGPCAGYLDAIDKWGHADVPEVPVEFGDAHRLVQAGNRHVRDWGYPVKYDLAAQLLPDVNRRLDLAMGGTIPIILRGYGIDVTQRLLRAEIAHFHPDRAQCSLARRAQLLTDFVPGG